MSTYIENANTHGELPSFAPSGVHRWLARRRITISLTGFTSLVLINVFVRQTLPHNPFALNQPQVLLGLWLLCLGLGLRTWSAGTLNKSRELTIVGPYSLVRNPLYVGSFLMMLGFCILCRDWLTIVFVAGPLTLLYWYQVRFEEMRLADAFPSEWANYVRTTPRFIPHRIGRQAFVGWSLSEWLRNREYNAICASGVGVIGIFIWYLIRASY